MSCATLTAEQCFNLGKEKRIYVLLSAFTSGPRERRQRGGLIDVMVVVAFVALVSCVCGGVKGVHSFNVLVLWGDRRPFVALSWALDP